jgi:hypothetical protein
MPSVLCRATAAGYAGRLDRVRRRSTNGLESAAVRESTPHPIQTARSAAVALHLMR